MLPKHLRSFAFRKLQGRIVAFLIASFVFALFAYYNYFTAGTEDKSKLELKVIQNTLNGLKSKILKSEFSLKLWNDRVRKEHSDRSGIKVKQAKIILDDLKKVHQISNLVINLSNPEIRQDFQDAKFCNITYTEMGMTFSSFTDLDAYSFLNSSLHEIPGHIQVKALTLTAVPSIDDSVLNNIASGRFTDVVNVKVELLWEDIMDKTAANPLKAPAKQPPGKPAAQPAQTKPIPPGK